MGDHPVQVIGGDRALTKAVHAVLYMIGTMVQPMIGVGALNMVGLGALTMVGTGVLNMGDIAVEHQFEDPELRSSSWSLGFDASGVA